MKDSNQQLAMGCAMVMGLIVVMPVMGVLFGAFAGWIVGLFFTPTILDFLRRLGVDTAGLQVWQIGAAMGFFGGFLKTSVTKRD